MARVRIPVEQLPPPNKYGDHNVQFRIVSEDRNRVSAWSTFYGIKSLGQYRPLESNVTVVADTGSALSIAWDTPTIYNYSLALPSASIAHNHSANYKQHPTDIFIKFHGTESDDHFHYHDRVISDNTTIIKENSNVQNVTIVGLVATYGLPEGISGADLDQYVADLSSIFKVFEYFHEF